jgi:putative transcriptional regulator
MAELHNTLKVLRTQMGFTQASLAEKVGVSRKTINTIENHVFTPSTLLAMQIARTLDVTVHDIFYVKDD